MENQPGLITVDIIERTLHQLYNDVQSQAQADTYLMLVQTSPEAWNFSWQLLHPSKSHEAQFFGANTLQMKISKHWNELSSDQYGALREKLLKCLLSYTAGNKVILTRLCIAMSSYIMQTITDFWPTAIQDLISTFQSHNIPSVAPEHIAYVLVELLTVLSEEFITTHMPQSRVGIVRNALQSSFTLVMELIQDILSRNTAPVELCEMSLKCYSSWAQLGSTVLEYDSLMMLTFDSVYRDELAQTALETLSNIANHPNASKYPTVVIKMVENSTRLDGLLQQAIQDDDMDKCCGIYSLIIALAENHCKLLLDTLIDKPEHKDNILRLISFILKCSATPGQYPVEEICSEQAFGFWYTLQDTIVSSETKRFEALLLVFYPVFQTLLDTYLVKVRYPSDDVYREWKSDEQESFRCYRQDIGDSFMFCYNILKSSALANLMAHLTIATSVMNSDPSQWQYLEACLFGFKEVAESVNIKEHCYIPQFMSHLRSIPLQHLKIISGTMEAIGSYAEWINAHPDILGCIIPLLLMGLKHSEVAPSASFALKDVTRDCYASLQPFAEEILKSSQDALNDNVLKSRERVRVMCTIGKVLSVMPYTYIMNFLNTFLPPMLDHLQEVLHAQKSVPNSNTIIVLRLHMLSMLFNSLNTRYDKGCEDENSSIGISEEESNNPQPILPVVEKVLSIFCALGINWDVNEEITEALCDALKRAVCTLSDECKTLLPNMLKLIVFLYKRCPLSSVLDMSKQLFLLFANDNDTRDQLSACFTEICNHTIQLSMEDFRESTTVTEMFMCLLAQVLKKALVFYRTESINLLVLFQYALAALSLPEKPTVKSASGFLTEFIIRSREVPTMLNVVNNQGEILVMQVIKVIGGDSPRSVVEYMPDILMALNKKYFDNLCRWMVPVTQQDGFPSNKVTRQQKEEFTRLILRERSSKRKLKETVVEFSLLCRGLIGTEYGAQSCQSLSDV